LKNDNVEIRWREKERQEEKKMARKRKGHDLRLDRALIEPITNIETLAFY
jgi:hypothetical protein